MRFCTRHRWPEAAGLLGVVSAAMVLLGLLAYDRSAFGDAARSAAGACAGDCGTDESVSVDDVMLMVNIALGIAPLDACAVGDVDGDGHITVDEIIAAVDTALAGCPMKPRPTLTPTPTTPPLPALPVPSPGAILANVTVVNPGIGRRGHQTITIVGDTILSVDDLDDSERASGAQQLAGRYVLPGLIDMHVHRPEYSLLDTRLFVMLYLLHGVTTVRDTGNFTGSIFPLREMVNSGRFPGPRIFACGTILDGSPPVRPGSCVVTNTDEARHCVEQQVAVGANCIKVYNNLSEAALAAIREATVPTGLPLIGHIPLAAPFERAGIVDVQHLTGVPALSHSPEAHYLDWLVDAWQQMDEARIDFIVRASVAQGIAHTPTVVVVNRISRVLTDYGAERNDPAALLLPRYYREQCSWDPGCSPSLSTVAPATIAAFPGMIGKMKGVIRQLHAAGVPIYVGSDTLNPFVVPGAGMHEELQHLHDSGLTVEELWIAATRAAGAALGDPLLGTIQPGAPADLLVFHEDPTQDLAALASLEAVIAQGRLYRTDDLRAASRQYRDHLDARFGSGAEVEAGLYHACAH
jgi:hypothetical protein